MSLEIPEERPEAMVRRRMLMVVRDEMGGQLFTASSLLNLVDEVDTAATRMVAEDRLAEEDLAEADDAMRRFMSLVDEERSALGYSEFHEDTIARARFRICPPALWPFC